ncbi:MAG: hypothetical protein SangKO_072790 [Sandaracinaceae bacterium]
MLLGGSATRLDYHEACILARRMTDRPVFGVNLPWLFGSYGHDLAINEHYADWGYAWDEAEAARALAEVKEFGFDAVRIWLCENGEGVVTDGGAVRGVHPALLSNLARLQEMLAAEGLVAYWTLLDGNSWKREGDALSHAILTDPAQTARFAERVAAPISEALDPALTFALEVVNEPEVMTPECTEAPTASWETLARGIATVGDAFRGRHRVTSGTMHVFLPSLWAAEPRVDAIDVHLYHPQGGLPPRSHLARYCEDPAVADAFLVAGECGLPDEVGGRALLSYLENAVTERYDGVFLWRLEHVLVTQDDTRAITETGHEVRAVLERLKG